MKIIEMWAYTCIDDDQEAIPAFKIGNMAMPVVGADRERMKSFEPKLQDLANETGKTFTLKKFSVVEIYKVIEPKGNTND